MFHNISIYKELVNVLSTIIKAISQLCSPFQFRHLNEILKVKFDIEIYLLHSYDNTFCFLAECLPAAR